MPQIDLTFTQVASALAQVRSGQLKAYAVMAKTRWAATPDTPTTWQVGRRFLNPDGRGSSCPPARPGKTDGAS
jgi:tripartite-type tricarboxylate transporter receptor subunit TctC